MKFSNACFLILSLYILIFFSSCRVLEDPDKIITPDWSPEVAIPLINTELAVQQLLDEMETSDYLQVDGNGLLTLHHDTRTFTLGVEDILSIQNLSISMNDTVKSVPFPVMGIEEIHLKEGRLQYHFTSDAAGAVVVQITLPNLHKEGEILTEQIIFNGPKSVSGSIDLTGYIFETTDGSVSARYSAKLQDTGQKILLNNFTFDIVDWNYSFAAGYMGQYPFNPGKDTVELDLFNEVKAGGNIFLADPRIEVSVRNSFGIPIEVTANRLEVIAQSGSAISFNTNELASGITLNYPQESNAGTYATTTTMIHKDNSDLPHAISNRPAAITWDFSGLSHPAGNTGTRGFITDSSRFYLDLNTSLPLDLSLQDLAFDQTFEVDLSDMDAASSAEIRLITENGLPLDVQLQAYFYDEDEQILDSLFNAETLFLSGAPVDASGKVTGSESETLIIDLPAAKYSRVENTRSMRILATVSTTGHGSQPVKFFNDYTLGVKMGIKGKK